MKIVATIALLIAVSAVSGQAGAAQASRKMPLDHGPRATSTPWLNKQLLANEAKRARTAQVKAQVRAEPVPAADTLASR